MKLKVMASGSRANGYLLSSQDNQTLMIEAGVHLRTALPYLDHSLEGLLGVLVTHEHGDHAGRMQEYLDMRINVFATRGTLEAKGYLDHPLARVVEYGKRFTIGDYQITPFPVYHDVLEPCGFYIYHPEMGSVIFATDTHTITQKFGKIDHLMIECNYQRDILRSNVDRDIVHIRREWRTAESHLSLETLLEVLKNMDLSLTNEIVLLHLSRDNANPEEMKEAVELATGKIVYIAEKGLELDFNKDPF